MKKTIINSLLLLIALSFSLIGYAQESTRTIEQVYKECGLGGLFFGNSSPTLAFISNVTWDLGTTAASSDASSDESGCISKSATAAVFIGKTIASLEEDLSKGHGEYLATLSTMMGCQNADVQVRKQYAQFVADQYYDVENSKEKAETLYSIVNTILESKACGAA